MSGAEMPEHRSTEELNFGSYDALVERGTGTRLIVAVASMGAAGSVPPFEWRKSLARIVTDEHVIYLRDRTTSWFNNPYGWAELIAFINRYRRDSGITRSYVFGISMGGFGAALLAAELPFDRVLLLAPQVAIDHSADFDWRFRNQWAAIPEKPRPQLQPLANPAGDCILCYSIDNAFDVAHVARLKAIIPTADSIALRGDHNIALDLIARGEHRILLDQFLERETNGAITRFGGDIAQVELLAELHLQGQFEAIQIVVDEAVVSGDAATLPAFSFAQLANSLLHRAAPQHRTYHETLQHVAYPAHRGITVLSGGLQPYLAEGWSAPELLGSWSIHRSAYLRLQMIDPDTNGDGHGDGHGDRDFALTMKAEAFAPDGFPQEVIVRSAGRELFRQQVVGHGNTALRIHIVVPGPLIELEIQTPNAVSPAIANGTQDYRKLGIWLQYLSIGYAPRTATRA